ncbi:MAG: hypothetical protein H6Q83_1607, partial [Deltaproteobacteria bacterium]|nr:hypothetical protein [Deltaproteobacteria bacterium]
PAHPGQQQAVDRTKGRQKGEDAHNPHRKGYLGAHRHSLPPRDGI